MEMPTLTDAHKKLERLAGKWTGTEKMHPSPWDPKGGEAQATVHNRVSVGGFAVVQDYEQKRGGQVTFSGHGVFRYDAQRERYTMHWFDSMGMSPNEFAGAFDGDVLTMEDESPMGRTRATIDLTVGPAKYEFKMEMSPDGKSWQTLMEGRYQRAATG